MTPYEVAQQFSQGNLSRDELIEILVGWEYVVNNDRTDGYDWLLFPVDENSFGSVTRALNAGLIDGEIYDDIINQLEEKEARNIT